MKVTLKDLWNARGTLGKLSGMPFRAKTAYRLMKLIDQANKEIEPFARVRQDLFMQYVDQEGEMVTIKPENVEAFAEDHEEALGLAHAVDRRRQLLGADEGPNLVELLVIQSLQFDHQAFVELEEDLPVPGRGLAHVMRPYL